MPLSAPWYFLVDDLYQYLYFDLHGHDAAQTDQLIMDKQSN